MLALLHLLLSWLAAFVLLQALFGRLPVLIRIVGAGLVGLVLTGWVHYGAAALLHALGLADATFHGAIVAMAANAAVVVAGRARLRLDAVRLTRGEALGAGAALAVGAAIVGSHLSGYPLTVSANTWGDTALHIGLARSFSMADNFPTTLPIYAGEPIRYHFGFDFLAGGLERLGLPLAWAFTLPGAFAFAGVLVLLGELGRHVLGSTAAGVGAALLFVGNSSLAFLRYLERHPTPAAALDPATWWNHQGYLAIGPYQADEPIAIFWTLNPWLNQTHLTVTVALVLFVVAALLVRPGGTTHVTPVQAAALGLLAGASFWLNGVVFLAASVLVVVLLVLDRGDAPRRTVPTAVLVTATAAVFVVGALLQSDLLRVAALGLLGVGLVLLGNRRVGLPYFAAAGVAAVPQVLWLSGGGGLRFHTGYLVQDFRVTDPASWADLAGYWWLNVGLVGPLVLLAAFVVPRERRALLGATTAVFLVGNLVTVGLDVGGHNHKVFNLWEVLVNLYAAYALVWLVRRLWTRGRVPGRAAAGVLTVVAAVLLGASGLLDLMTIKNDPRYGVFGDRQPAVSWIEASTARDAVFLTAPGEVYTVPTLAGRAVYLGGFPSWVEGYGYPVTDRQQVVEQVYEARSPGEACRLLTSAGIDYLQLGFDETKDGRFPGRDPDLFARDFVTAYSDPRTVYYDVAASCATETGQPPATAPGVSAVSGSR